MYRPTWKNLERSDGGQSTPDVEEALRLDLGLEPLERIWAKVDLGENEALRLAVEKQHKARRR